MSVLAPESTVESPPIASSSLAGYRVFGPEGWVGTVVDTYGDRCLLVVTGLFRRRSLTVLSADIDQVKPLDRTVTLHRDPRGFVALGIAGGH